MQASGICRRLARYVYPSFPRIQTQKPRKKAKAIARSQMDQIYPGRLYNAIKMSKMTTYVSTSFKAVRLCFPDDPDLNYRRGFWDMWKAGAVRLFHRHIPKS